MNKKYLSRNEIRKIIQKCLILDGITLADIKRTVRYYEKREKDFVEQRYGY